MRENQVPFLKQKPSYTRSLVTSFSLSLPPLNVICCRLLLTLRVGKRMCVAHPAGPQWLGGGSRWRQCCQLRLSSTPCTNYPPSLPCAAGQQGAAQQQRAAGVAAAGKVSLPDLRPRLINTPLPPATTTTDLPLFLLLFLLPEFLHPPSGCFAELHRPCPPTAADHLPTGVAGRQRPF